MRTFLLNIENISFRDGIPARHSSKMLKKKIEGFEIVEKVVEGRNFGKCQSKYTMRLCKNKDDGRGVWSKMVNGIPQFRYAFK